MRAGVIPGPERPAWTLEDAYPVPSVEQPPDYVAYRGATLGERIPRGLPDDPNVLTTETTEPLPRDAHETAVLELVGRPAAVLGAAFLVQEAFERAHGELHRACVEARAYAAGASRFDMYLADKAALLSTALNNAALCDQVQTYGTATESLQFEELCRLLDYAGIGAASRADAMYKFASSVEERLLAANQIYENERHGPKMHYLDLLDELVQDNQLITEILGDLPSRSDFEHVMDWEDARDTAVDGVYRRILRAKAKFQRERRTRDALRRVPLERRALVVFCRYVPRGPVSLHFRSGGGMPGADRERSPLDPNRPTP
jgi:hypothetical protein